MKVLIVRNSPTIVNLNNYNNQEMGLAKALTKKGNKVGIVFYTDKEYSEEIKNDITIYYLPAKKLLNYGIYDDRIYKICEKYDVIQTSEYNQIMSYRLVKRYPQKTVIYHGPYYRKKLSTIINNIIFYIFYLRKYRKLNPRILTKSILAEKFVRSKGFNNVITVGVGLDNSKFSNKKQNSEFNGYYKKENINLLSIATIEKRKNTLFLLKVLNKLVKIDDKYFLFLIGKTNEQKYKEKCLDYIKKNKLDNNVAFINNVNQDELSDIYTKTSILLLPSNYEIFGMVLLEALYFKTPILSSLNGGSSYLLNEDNIAFEFNSDEWVKKILACIKNNLKNKKILWKDKTDEFINAYGIGK